MSNATKNFLFLVITVFLVHAAYIAYIRPEAEQRIENSREAGQSAPRDLVVIVKDHEQEFCFILMFLGTFLIFQRYRSILKNHHLFSIDFIAHAQQSGDAAAGQNMDASISGLDAQAIMAVLDAEVPGECKSSPLFRTLRQALLRYSATRNVQNLSDAVESSLEALSIQQDAENSMIRYLIWVIPSIGFIGTVRGIGMALSQADQALAGNIALMTNSLGVAFNSTLVALLLSVLLVFLYHQLQVIQDREILETQAYCDKYLLGRLPV